VPRGEDRQWGGMRLDHNTADLRGLRVDEALLACELVFDAVLLTGEDTAWVLHGHGTGVLKQAVRAWLPQQAHVKRFRPADAGEGGDAYTVVQLR
jgi:DNA mismatch repair protein MutS2